MGVAVSGRGERQYIGVSLNPFVMWLTLITETTTSQKEISTEVAAVLGFSVEAVKSRLHRARSLARDALPEWVE